jgi:hypothetical protein
MTTRIYFTDVAELAYSEALELIAVGEEREAARGHLIDAWPEIEGDVLNDVLADALRDALKQGVEREDIDPSWF